MVYGRISSVYVGFSTRSLGKVSGRDRAQVNNYTGCDFGVIRSE